MRGHVTRVAVASAMALGVAVAPASARAVGEASVSPGTDLDITAASWTEPDWCSTRQPLDDLAPSFSADTLRQTLIEIAKRRYPPAVAVFTNASQDAVAKYVTIGPLDPHNMSFGLVRGLFPGLVHELGHEWDQKYSGRGYAYRFFDGRVDHTASITTFPRGEILKRHPNPNDDEYADLYLRGGSGRSGINNLLEEFVQYVHQLAASTCLLDDDPATSDTFAEENSSPGAALTMMWYMETYLGIAREKHPKDYQRILRARGLRVTILDTWRRAEYWLAKSGGVPAGSFAKEMEQRVRAPQNIAEIQRLAAR